MKDITFNELPQAVSQLYNKLENIERLLLAQSNEPHPQTNQLLTIQQAADFLNLAKPTIYAKAAKRTIPFCKQGKRLYFSKDELSNWVNEGRKKTVREIQAETNDFLGKKGGK